MIESRSRDPLVPLQIFRSGALRRANIGAVTLFGSYVSFQFLATQYLQSLAGWSAISTALAFLPAGVMVAVLSVGVGPLLGRFGTGRLAAAAFACLVAAYAVFLRAWRRPGLPGCAAADDAACRAGLRPRFLRADRGRHRRDARQ